MSTHGVTAAVQLREGPDRDVRGLRRRESDGHQALLELVALPTLPDVFLGLPDAHDVERILAGRTVMPQLAKVLGAAGRHDHCGRTVVGTSHLGHVTGKIARSAEPPHVTSDPWPCRCREPVHPSPSGRDTFAAAPSSAACLQQSHRRHCRHGHARSPLAKSLAGEWWDLFPTCSHFRTRVRAITKKKTVWPLCTAIPIRELRQRRDGSASAKVSTSRVCGITQGSCRW